MASINLVLRFQTPPPTPKKVYTKIETKYMNRQIKTQIYKARNRYIAMENAHTSPAVQ